ncbi:glycosyltransferase [Phycisphaera mikurensis]|uniref:Putative glycosyltransferase n=1 Tax=Phycisphaera mikurensis (strain NBRC 102666 / KCTC 22515 / FYK2301M01) TaxID=1142394 RepID=I0IAE3_PHYMF|nr:glycosyltransferase [Phycisphaera mikurensis]MBB6441773.1 glycosyltransferase involved in cell wall biosynthesis [Phycisphaera mikurensis]BAM02231.1 putative glycosyltransferase [Phycisphaera mikurensis NBRC 102666]
MDRPLRLVHAVPSWCHSAYRATGVSRAAWDLADALAEAGHHVDVVCPEVDLAERFVPPAERVFRDGRLKVHTVPEARTTRFGTGRNGLDAVATPLIQQADLVHVHAFFSPWSDRAARLAQSTRTPYVVQPHGKLSPSMLASQRRAKAVYLGLYGKRLLTRASAVIVLAEGIADSVHRWLPEARLEVCPNGLSPEEYAEPPADRPTNHPYLLYLGLIDPRKRIDLLLEAMPTVLAQRPGLRLALVGGDRYGHLPDLQPQIDALGDAVLLPGHVSGETKLQWLHHAEAFALASDGEGLSLSMLEALACGLPCLLSPGCNAPEVEEAGAGETVASTPSAWADALIRWSDRSQRHRDAGRAAQRLFQERFTLRAVSERMTCIYKDVLAR